MVLSGTSQPYGKASVHAPFFLALQKRLLLVSFIWTFYHMEIRVREASWK